MEPGQELASLPEGVGRILKWSALHQAPGQPRGHHETRPGVPMQELRRPVSERRRHLPVSAKLALDMVHGLARLDHDRTALGGEPEHMDALDAPRQILFDLPRAEPPVQEAELLRGQK